MQQVMEQQSKTKRKQQIHQLQQLGVQLAAQRESVWQELGLDEPTCRALNEYNRLTREAKRRQAQYIGKLLRHYNQEDLEEHFAARQRTHRHRDALAARLPGLFDELLAGQLAVDKLARLLPGLDVHQCAQYVAAAHQGRPRAKKQLWALLLQSLPKVG